MRRSPVFQRACEPPPSIVDEVWYLIWNGGSQQATALRGRAAKTSRAAILHGRP